MYRLAALLGIAIAATACHGTSTCEDSGRAQVLANPARAGRGDEAVGVELDNGRCVTALIQTWSADGSKGCSRDECLDLDSPSASLVCEEPSVACFRSLTTGDCQWGSTCSVSLAGE